MPRIKALMTGSVPSFSDIILNVAESDSASTLAHQDNLLIQFKMGLGKRMVMYGDDTWLRLFPGTFDRFDGTTSFFVSVSLFVSQSRRIQFIEIYISHPGLC
jgi:ethanolaminephosphotransferase